MATYVPSIWDYIAQAGSAGVGGFTNARNTRDDRAERERTRIQQEELALLNILAQGVSSGSVFSDQANANPIAKSRGMVFQPSKTERASRIASSPGGMPSVSGPMIPGMPMSPIITRKPWSDDQMRLAGLPTSTERKVEKVTGQRADLELSTSPFKAYEPVFTDQAERFVAQAANSGVDVERFPALIAQSAYNQWLESQQASGDMAVSDPALQQYARSYFDKAVQSILDRRAELDALRVRAANSGAGGRADQLIQWAKLLEARKENLLAPFPWIKLLPTERLQTFTNPNSDSYNESVVFALQEMSRLDQALNEISGTQPGAPISASTMQTIQGLTGNGGGSATPAAPAETPSGGSSEGPPPMSDEDLRRAITQGGQIPSAQRQAWFDKRKNRLNEADRSRIAGELGVNP